MFPENSGYNYSNCRLFLLKTGEEHVYIKGNTGLKTRDCYLQCENLEEGNYSLFCEVDWLSSSPESSFVVTCYGTGGANFENETNKKGKESLARDAMKAMVA